MESIVTSLTEQHLELEGLLSGLTDEAWSLPTRCPGWSVADVVLHLAQTDAVAVASRFRATARGGDGGRSEGSGPLGLG